MSLGPRTQRTVRKNTKRRLWAPHSRLLFVKCSHTSQGGHNKYRGSPLYIMNPEQHNSKWGEEYYYITMHNIISCCRRLLIMILLLLYYFVHLLLFIPIYHTFIYCYTYDGVYHLPYILYFRSSTIS